MERGPIPAQADEDGRPALQVAFRPAEMFGKGDARHRLHLERADDADPVVAADPVGVGRIEGFQPEAERVPAVPTGLLLQRGPDGVVPAGSREKAFEQSLDVQPRAADDDREAVPSDDRSGGFGRPDGEIRGRELDPAIDDIQEMVGDAGPLGGAGLVRSDVESPVHLHRVGVDDLSPESLGQEKRYGGLAHRRRADDDGDARVLRAGS